MNRKLIWLLTVLVFPAEHFAQAQKPTKVSRIGYLIGGGPSDRVNWDAFLEGLRGFGYHQGVNVIIERRSAELKETRLPELGEELVRLNPSVIVAATATAARAIKKVTSTIPIVMANAADPIGSGLVVSLAHPGGNVTGTTNYSPELAGKRIELLRDTLPKLRKVGIIYDATGHTIRDKSTRRSG